MKTIEEAAREYAHCIWESWKEEHPSDYESNVYMSVHDFKAGVEYAQRWISVDDELPEESGFYLTKVSEKNVRNYPAKTRPAVLFYDLYYTGKKQTGRWMDIDDVDGVKYWRPIELK